MLQDNRAKYFRGYRSQEQSSAGFLFQVATIGVGLFLLSAMLTVTIVNIGSGHGDQVFYLSD